jgi:uncharacterized protein (TIGR02271 family)
MLETLRRSQQRDDVFMTEEMRNLDICDYKVISDDGDKIGKVHDYVTDSTGRLRYFVVDSGNWFRGKRILVPVGMMGNIDDKKKEVILSGMTKEQVNALPPYDENQELDEAYEGRVLGSYYPNYSQKGEFATRNVNYDELERFEMPERIRLIEERLMINKRQEKVGEVHLRKTVETRTETVEVPVTEEHLIIERHPVGETTTGMGTETRSEDVIGQNESVDIPLYREEVEVSKRPVASEEVTVRKEKRTDTRKVKEDVRKERLNVDNPENIDIDDR